jgi:hypothetical protein
METSYRATVESASTAAVESSAATTMTTTLGKGSLGQPDKCDTSNHYAKGFWQGGFHHLNSPVERPLDSSTQQNLYTPRG